MVGKPGAGLSTCALLFSTLHKPRTVFLQTQLACLKRFLSFAIDPAHTSCIIADIQTLHLGSLHPALLLRTPVQQPVQDLATSGSPGRSMAVTWNPGAGQNLLLRHHAW